MTKTLEVIYLPHYDVEKFGELKFSHQSDSCFDLRAAITSDYFLYHKYPLSIETGIKLKIPKGYEVVIRPRSGLGSKGIVANYGTIDEDYRGELKVILFNFSDYRFTIRPGDRIAQATMQKKPKYVIKRVYEFSDVTERNENGFGSTGIK